MQRNDRKKWPEETSKIKVIAGEVLREFAEKFHKAFPKNVVCIPKDFPKESLSESRRNYRKTLEKVGSRKVAHEISKNNTSERIAKEIA